MVPSNGRKLHHARHLQPKNLHICILFIVLVWIFFLTKSLINAKLFNFQTLKPQPTDFSTNVLIQLSRSICTLKCIDWPLNNGCLKKINPQTDGLPWKVVIKFGLNHTNRPSWQTMGRWTDIHGLNEFSEAFFNLYNEPLPTYLKFLLSTMWQINYGYGLVRVRQRSLPLTFHLVT